MKPLLLILCLISTAWAQTPQPRRKIIYEYKKYEKFDFEELAVEGDAGAPGDLSVAPAERKDYGNRLPERKEFMKELRKSASGIR